MVLREHETQHHCDFNVSQIPLKTKLETPGWASPCMLIQEVWGRNEESILTSFSVYPDVYQCDESRISLISLVYK